MKIHIDLPWGGVFHIEKKPMDDDTKILILFFGVIVAIVSMFVLAL